MKRQMIHTLAGVCFGAALLAVPSAHAQSGSAIESLWAPSKPMIERVNAGDRAGAEALVGEVFHNMLCATDGKGHYVIGQHKGKVLQKVVDVPPTQMKNVGQNTIHWWGQAQFGKFKGYQFQGLFKQVGPGQIDARVRIAHSYGKKPIDCVVAFHMKQIYQKPATVEPKKDEPKKDEPKKDEPKKDEPKKDDCKGEKCETPHTDPGNPPTGNGNTGSGSGGGSGTGSGSGSGSGSGGDTPVEADPIDGEFPDGGGEELALPAA